MPRSRLNANRCSGARPGPGARQDRGVGWRHCRPPRRALPPPRAHPHSPASAEAARVRPAGLPHLPRSCLNCPDFARFPPNSFAASHLFVYCTPIPGQPLGERLVERPSGPGPPRLPSWPPGQHPPPRPRLVRLRRAPPRLGAHRPGRPDDPGADRHRARRQCLDRRLLRRARAARPGGDGPAGLDLRRPASADHGARGRPALRAADAGAVLAALAGAPPAGALGARCPQLPHGPAARRRRQPGPAHQREHPLGHRGLGRAGLQPAVLGAVNLVSFLGLLWSLSAAVPLAGLALPGGMLGLASSMPGPARC